MYLFASSGIRTLTFSLFLILFLLTTATQVQAQASVEIQGEFKRFHRVSVLVTCSIEDCGEVDILSNPNPFTDYRLLVTFREGSSENELTIPGFYAGDGRAAYSEADSGNVWKVHFSPPEAGEWTYEISFESGEDIVLHREAGTPLPPDGETGDISILDTDKTGRDFRSKGFLRYANAHYYYFSGTNTPFLKNGAGSPENLLYYHEFVNTYQYDTTVPIPAHEFPIHISDFNEGDPLWGPDQDKGKGMMGALNYLASLDVNSFYFIVNNTAIDTRGQGTAIWPWITPGTENRDRFSVAKLDQWEVVFSHMDSLGISMNVITQDRINQWDLDDGELGRIRKLYYRELIARFGHHLGVVWNIGEENSATTDQIKAYSNFISEWDAYDHPIVSQANGALDAHHWYYLPLLGFEQFDGASLQVGLVDFDSLDVRSDQPGKIHGAVLKWIEASSEIGRPWVVMLDEIGHWSDGIVPDGDPRDPTNRRARREGFWGTIMAGGAGSDWYYGSDPFEYNDLWSEDFTLRSDFFRRTGDGVRMILDNEIPYWEMENMNDRTSLENTWVFGKEGEIYMVYSPFQEPFALNLPEGEYNIQWYDAFDGGALQVGTIEEVEIESGGDWVSIGSPIGFSEDAVALVTLEPPDVSIQSEKPGENRSFILMQNYPNPARYRTTIEYELSEPGYTTLTVYDLLGRKVVTPVDAYMQGGRHKVEVQLDDLPSGVYVYTLKFGDKHRQERFIVF